MPSCAQVLDLDGYSFARAGTAGVAGAGAADLDTGQRFPRGVARVPGLAVDVAGAGAGAGGSAGGSSSEGPDVVDWPGPPSVGPAERDAGDSGTGADPDAGAHPPEPGLDPDACAADERCAPSVPPGWEGPLVLSQAATACPASYPTPLGELNAGLQPGHTSCSCLCNIDRRSCSLLSPGGDPPPVCNNPGGTTLCYAVTAEATCSAVPIAEIVPSYWLETARACGAPAASGACGSGACYPSADGFGPLCIAHDGAASCPAEFPHARTYHRGINDSRHCAGSCGCRVEDASCGFEVLVCRLLFGSRQVSVASGDELCLQSLESVDILAERPPGGTCVAEGLELAGAVEPADPVTVCCLE